MTRLGYSACSPRLIFAVSTLLLVSLSAPCRSEYVLELLLKSYENRHNKLEDGSSCAMLIRQKYVCSPHFNLTLWSGSDHRSWLFGGNRSGYVGTELLYFPELLASNLSNPIIFLGKFNELVNNTLFLEIADGSLGSVITRMSRPLNLPRIIASSRDVARLQHINMHSNGVKMSVFVRYYCATGWSGDQCEQSCDGTECLAAVDQTMSPHSATGIVATALQVDNNILIASDQSSICRNDPCIVLDVPSKQLLNFHALHSVLSIAISMRNVNLWQHLLSRNAKLGIVKVHLDLTEVVLPSGRRFVTVGVKAFQGGHAVSRTQVDHAIADLEQHQWIPVGANAQTSSTPTAVQIVPQRFNYNLWGPTPTTTIPITGTNLSGMHEQQGDTPSQPLLVGGLVTFVLFTCILAVCCIYLYLEKRRREYWVPAPQPAVRHRSRIRRELVPSTLPDSV